MESWVVEVEESLEAETRPDESPAGLIHTVPKSLLRENTKMFYYPEVISLGPYHFTIEKKLDYEAELLKSEVARQVHHKIKGSLQSSEKVKSPDPFGILLEEENESYVKNERGLKWVMESFFEKKERIKESYSKKIDFTDEVCAWMIARDACFVLHVLEMFREKREILEDEDAEKSVSASICRTLRRKQHHPLLTEIVKDMLKMENQLPLWALTDIRSDIMEWLESALKNLSPIEVADVGKRRVYDKESHLLQWLHDYIVDSQQNPETSAAYPSYTKSDSFKSCIIILLCRCLFVWNSVFHCEFDWESIKELFSGLVYGIILLVLSPVLFILLIIFVIQAYVSPKWEIREHAPTVDELKRAGVKFKKLEDKKKGISHIKFKESNSTLYLPQFKVDNRSEVILRNLIALEICSQREEKPITRYAILMNDLINTSEDVAILRREDIITSKLGSDEEIARLWNSMATSTQVPTYNPIDYAVSSIGRYRKKWWKVLWAQFIMAYCSKPWLFLSLVAGILLLLLTFVQVVCLFESCQLK